MPILKLEKVSKPVTKCITFVKQCIPCKMLRSAFLSNNISHAKCKKVLFINSIKWSLMWNVKEWTLLKKDILHVKSTHHSPDISWHPVSNNVMQPFISLRMHFLLLFLFPLSPQSNIIRIKLKFQMGQSLYSSRRKMALKNIKY